MNRTPRQAGTSSTPAPPLRHDGIPEGEDSDGQRDVSSCLITGGAGFLGINLVRYLLERGIQVVSLDIAPFDYPERDSVKVFDGDIRDVDSVRAAMDGVDLVVHAAAALPLYSAEEIYSTDVDGIRNVLDAAHRSGINRVIHISSTAVYGIPDHHPLKEDDRLHGVGPYGKAKIEAEEICQEFRDKGMCVPIIRPKSFVGPERLGVFALFYDWAKDGKNFPMLGSGRNLYQLLDVEDLCSAIFLAASLPSSKVNDTFNIGATEFATMKEDYQAVLDFAGHGKRIIPLPAAPAIWTLRILERLGISPLYKWVYETAATDSFVDVAKAQRLLGWNPAFSNQDALVRNYIWYIENLASFKGSSGVSHRVPWSQGILKLAKVLFTFP
ncbi:MAG: NAD-dependent epimerase/dehydratase family protein [Caldilineaceae bacterium SB0665_bin_25]|nr:NAD-dependent epimerase/dehydratase family protein [Caldilineaceae bacterium SB0665_bin_25]